MTTHPHETILNNARTADLWDIDVNTIRWTPTEQSVIAMLWPQWDAPTITAVWLYVDDKVTRFTGDYAHPDDNDTTPIDTPDDLAAIINNAITAANETAARS